MGTWRIGVMRKFVVALAAAVLLATVSFVPGASAQVGYPYGYSYGYPYLGYPNAGYGYAFPGSSYAGYSYPYSYPGYRYGSAANDYGGWGSAWPGYSAPGDSYGRGGRVCIMIYPPPPGCW